LFVRIFYYNKYLGKIQYFRRIYKRNFLQIFLVQGRFFVGDNRSAPAAPPPSVISGILQKSSRICRDFF